MIFQSNKNPLQHSKKPLQAIPESEERKENYESEEHNVDKELVSVRSDNSNQQIDAS